MKPPRMEWTPELLERFGLRPWDMGQFTPVELDDLAAYVMTVADGG
jgi:hypothetical protein